MIISEEEIEEEENGKSVGAVHKSHNHLALTRSDSRARDLTRSQTNNSDNMHPRRVTSGLLPTLTGILSPRAKECRNDELNLNQAVVPKSTPKQLSSTPTTTFGITSPPKSEERRHEELNSIRAVIPKATFIPLSPTLTTTEIASPRVRVDELNSSRAMIPKATYKPSEGSMSTRNLKSALKFKSSSSLCSPRPQFN